MDDNMNLEQETKAVVYEAIENEKNSIEFNSKDCIEFFGNEEQRASMFRDWASYFGEVVNPENTVLNTFFKAKYSPLNEVLNTIRKVLSKYGLAIIQYPFINSNNMPSLKTIVTHKNGGVISFPDVSGKPSKDDIQQFGSIISYLRRFSINAIAGIMGEVDDDGNSASANVDDKKTKPLPTKKEISPLKTELIEICKVKAPMDKAKVVEILSTYGNKDGLVANINDEAEIKEAIEKLNKIKEKK